MWFVSIEVMDEPNSTSIDPVIYLAEHFPLLVWIIVVVSAAVLIGVLALLGYAVFSDRPVITKWFTIGGRTPAPTLEAGVKAKLADIGQAVIQLQGELGQRVRELQGNINKLTIERARIHSTYGEKVGDIYGGRAIRDHIERCQEEMDRLRGSISLKLDELSASLRDLLPKSDT